MKTKNIILASASPRRLEIMQEHGYEPRVLVCDIDESVPADIRDKEDVPMFLALQKALHAEKQLTAEGFDGDPPIIIAADTIVYNGKIIGKPQDENEAFEILSSLRNTCHEVITGVAVIKAGTHARTVFDAVTKVYFKDYSDREIWDYVKTGEPYDKAGGYAIQGTFGKYADHIEGSLTNVIGLPLEEMEKVLSLEIFS